MVQRLPDTSLTVALQQGGRDHFEWGVDRHMAADMYDAINVGTRATGNWAKGKVPEFPPYPRPKAKKQKKNGSADKRVSVADLYKRLNKRG